MRMMRYMRSPFRGVRDIANRFGTGRSRYSGANDSVSDYASVATPVGAGVGAIVGAAGGVVVPLYAGWKIVGYASDRLDFPMIIEIPTQIVGACMTCAFCTPIALPVLAIAGAAAGALTGLVAGTVVGVGKKSIDTVLRR